MESIYCPWADAPVAMATNTGDYERIIAGSKLGACPTFCLCQKPRLRYSQ